MAQGTTQNIPSLDVPNSSISEILRSKTITILPVPSYHRFPQSDFLYVLRKINTFVTEEQSKETLRFLEALETKRSMVPMTDSTTDPLLNSEEVIRQLKTNGLGNSMPILSALAWMLDDVEGGKPQYSISSLDFPELFLSTNLLDKRSLQLNPICRSEGPIENVTLCELNLYTSESLKVRLVVFPLGRLFWNRTMTHWIGFMDLRGNLLALRTEIVPTLDMPQDDYYREYFAEGFEYLVYIGNCDKYEPWYLTDIPPFDEHKCVAVFLEGAVDSIEGIDDAFGNLDKVGEVATESLIRDGGEPVTAREEKTAKLEPRPPPFRILHQVTKWDTLVIR